MTDQRFTLDPDLMRKLEEPHKISDSLPGGARPFHQTKQGRPLGSVNALSLAERARRRKVTFDFPIPELDDVDAVTGETVPFVAQVRQPSLVMLLRSGNLPAHLHALVDKMVADPNTAATLDGRQQDAMDEIGGPADQLVFLFEVVDRLCISGFEEPRLVATMAEEEDDPSCIWIERVPEAARMRYWGMIREDQEAISGDVATFPGVQAQPGAPGSDLRPDGVPSKRRAARRSS